VSLLEAIRIVNPAIRFYQASTSEMCGKVQEIPQVESMLRGYRDRQCGPANICHRRVRRVPGLRHSRARLSAPSLQWLQVGETGGLLLSPKGTSFGAQRRGICPAVRLDLFQVA